MGPSAKETRRLRIVVCDTGPILHLRESRALDLLPAAGEVVVPRAVDEELMRLLPDWRRGRPKWLKVRVVRKIRKTRTLDPAIVQLTRELGAGEMEAIVLALSLPADWLLTDDAEARAIANLMGLEVHGSLGVILWAASAGYLTEEDAHESLDRLGDSSLWISSSVLTEAHRAVRRLFGG